LLMERFSPLLLEIWREVCRHIEIGESAARLAPILAKRIPGEVILVRCFDNDRSCVETVATGICRGSPAHMGARHDLSQEKMDRLLLWCRERRILQAPAPLIRDRLPGALPEEIEGEVMAGPLNTDEGPEGLLIITSQPAQNFRTEHADLFQALLEPFAVAL